MLSLPDILAAIRWWLVLLLTTTAVTPLAYTLFHRLADRGYAFTKMLGLLLVSYLFWLLTSFGFLANNTGGALFALLAVTAVSLLIYYRYSHGLLDWLRQNKTQILLTELIFALIFAFWVWVRAQNPAITATEKPMEFAFLNAVGRSPVFPPLDPWLSGYAISYYYFGYVMVSVIARLAAVAEPVAFNLGIAWLVASTAIGAFGLVYNLIATRTQSDAAPQHRQTAVLLGLIAALALPIAGNQQITMETLHASGIGGDGFWTWLDIRDINEPPVPDAPARYESTSWWWWRSSRVIHEYHLSGRAEEGLEPIAEFPGFSFILGDMHPHVLALPFAFLSLAVALLWYLAGRQTTAPPPINSWRHWLRLVPDWRLFALTALVLGGLSFLNTWDVLIHLFVVVAAYAIGRWQSHGWQIALLGHTFLLAVLLTIPAILLYLPFYIGFSSQAGAPYLLPMLMQPTRLPHFLVIFAMPLASIVLLVGVLLGKQRFRHWRLGLATAVSLILGLTLLTLLFSWILASSAAGAGRIANLASELGLTLAPRPDAVVALGWGFTAVTTILPAVVGARLSNPWLILLLAGLLGAIVMIWRHRAETAVPVTTQTTASGRLPFVLLLIFTAALLTLGPEFVYLRDNFGQRLNTIFKFYYQAWVMFGVAALVALHLLWQETRGLRLARLAPAAATAGYGLLFVLALMFPYHAIQSRAAEYRGPTTAEFRQPPTLNGLAYLENFNPGEYEAIQWLRQQPGTPVVVEAVGGQYSQYGRVSASTGLPTLLGWAGHQFQWRGPGHPEPGRRDPLVRDIYTQPNWEQTMALLNEFSVDYIYVGNLETSTYGPQVLQKFAGRLEIAYQNGAVTIFQWAPEVN